MATKAELEAETIELIAKVKKLEEELARGGGEKLEENQDTDRGFLTPQDTTLESVRENEVNRIVSIKCCGEDVHYTYPKSFSEEEILELEDWKKVA